MAQISQGNPINDAHKPHKNSHSTFDLSYNTYLTPLFGKYTPITAMEVVPDDGPIVFRNNMTTRSLSLSSPLLQDISVKKDFFEVPMEAILPFNWDKIYVNPVKGDDVNAVACNCVIPNLGKRVFDIFSANWSDIVSINFSLASFNSFIKLLLFAEKFFSSGSLLSYFGVNLSKCISFSSNGRVYSFDDFFDLFMNQVSTFADDNDLTYRSLVDDFRLRIRSSIDIRRVLDYLRSEPSSSFTSEDGSFQTFGIWLSEWSFSGVQLDTPPVNISRLLAYQIVCAHYYTNDKVDYVFTAELYRQYVYNLYESFARNFDKPVDVSFTYNGINTRYDYFSGFYLSELFTSDNLLIFSTWDLYLPIIEAIFGFNESLRYKDYFVGAKSQPLAVGDVNVAVADSRVSVVDVTRNIAVQRFLNSVNRVGMRISEYVKGIFGVDKFDRDFHEPAFLAHTSDEVFTAEIENTGTNQLSESNSVTSVLRGQSSNYEFTYYADRPCVLIGVEYFDIRRAYMFTQNPHTRHIDRFDMFLPDLQFIGDQPVHLSDLSASAPKDSIFGYQLRNMEYKQFYDIAVGGFASGRLPGWLFAYDDVRFESENTISPYFIRSHSFELDKYYISLSGYSLANYFHFIQKSEMFIKAQRPMVYAPEIL